MEEEVIQPKGRKKWLLIPLGVLLLWCGLSFLLPDGFVLSEGEARRISFSLPITLRVDDAGEVLAIEDNRDLPTETQPVFSFTAKPLSAGTADVTFYLFDSLPIKTVQAQVVPRLELIPVGKPVGVTMDSDGLLVLLIGTVEQETGSTSPAAGKLQVGDRLKSANGIALENKEVLQKILAKNDGTPVTFTVERDGEELRVSVPLAYSASEGCYRLGIWVRDSIQGIGTITYYDPATGTYGALGHGVYDVDTGELMEICTGRLTKAVMTDIKKGEAGDPGELDGVLAMDSTLGTVEKNTACGLFGEIEAEEFCTGESYPAATESEVHAGDAQILCSVDGKEPKLYDISILSVNPDHKEPGKAISLKITDEALLDATGGIVQGMSGSPILQDGKIVGAVTHVLVNHPEKGYGILIGSMLEESQS